MTGRTLKTISAALAAGLLAAAPASAALPDLVADPPVDVKVQHDTTNGDALLLRFTGYVHNAGAGAFEIDGTSPQDLLMGSVMQRIYDGGGGSTTQSLLPPAELRYETNDTHDHWHLMRIASYRLTTLDGVTDVAPAMKVGFCLMDSERRETSGPVASVYTADCERTHPMASSVSMGVSSGWRDIYGWSLAFQWVDVSAVQPGLYRLRADIDPLNVVHEANEVNAPAYSTAGVTVPGYVAKPQQIGAQQVGPVAVTLDATKFERSDWVMGTREWRIVDPPRNGTLDVPADRWFSDPVVHYTPTDPSADGDTFTYAARDSSSPLFPASPAAAAVTVDFNGKGPVAISGAPARMVAGSSVQLTASRPVTWSATAGSMTPDGLFRAPGDGTATVTARTSGGATAQTTIAIDPPPPVVSRPAAPVAAPGKPATASALQVTTARRGPFVAASVRTLRAGRVRLTLLSGKRRVRSCSFRVVRGRLYGCRLRVPKKAGPLTVSAVLVSAGHAPLVRRISVTSAHRH